MQRPEVQPIALLHDQKSQEKPEDIDTLVYVHSLSRINHFIRANCKTHGKGGHDGAWPSKMPGQRQVLETGGTRSVAAAGVLQEPQQAC